MANIARFKVLVPAISASGPGGTPVTDPQGLYAGAASDIPQGGARQIGQALVMGGTDVGGAIRGCTYITPHFPIPGFGEITYH